MSGQLTEAQKAVRSDKMLALNEQHAKEYEKSMLGGELKVLLEEEVEINGEQWYICLLYTSILSEIKPGQSVGIFIGPEGGFEEEEVAKALAAGARCV